MSKNKDEVVMRHIFEARLDKKMLGFLNKQGTMMDELLGILGSTKFAIQNGGARTELTNDETTETYFFSTDNFGFQLDASSDFEIFKNKLDVFCKILSEKEYFEIEKGIKRIGVKSQILYSRHNESPEKSLEKFNNKYNSINLDIEKLTGGKIMDVGYTYDIKLANGVCNVTFAPGSKKEIVGKVFADREKIYLSKIKGNGVRFFSIDSGNLGEPAAEKWEQLQTKAERQIDDVKKIYDGLNNFLDTNKN